MARNRLKFLRSETGFSLYTLSEYTHISPSLLNLLENGKRPFREAHLDTLCPFFDVTADFLLGKSDEGIGVYSSESNDADHTFISGTFYNDLFSKNVGRYRFVRLDPTGPVNVHRSFEFPKPENKYAVRRYFSAEMDRAEKEKREKMIQDIIGLVNQMNETSLEVIKQSAEHLIDFQKRRG